MKIGICFPGEDFDRLEFGEFSEFLQEMIKVGVNHFDFYMDFFLSLDYKKNLLIEFLKENDVKITIHYTGDIDKAEEKIKLFDSLIKIDYKVPIVFHLPSYKEKKYESIKEIISKIKNIVESTNHYILIETLSKNHPNNQNLGDDMSEINLFLKNIPNDNFGVCWDIGHTRANNIEERTSLLITDIKRIKMTHIHNVVYSDIFMDHVPLTNLNFQIDELNHLIYNKYEGVYSLEFPLKNIDKNIEEYITSIKKLRSVLNE